MSATGAANKISKTMILLRLGRVQVAYLSQKSKQNDALGETGRQTNVPIPAVPLPNFGINFSEPQFVCKLE